MEALAKQVLALQKEVRDKDKRLSALASSQPPAPAAPDSGSDTSMEATDEGKSLLSAISAARERLAFVQGIPVAQREWCFAAQGGYEAVLAEAKNELDAAHEANRDSKDLGVQKASAEQFLKRMEKAFEKATSKRAGLQAQIDDLTAKLMQATDAEAEAEKEVQKAAARLVAITDRALAELRATGGSPPPTPGDPGATPEGYVSVQFANAEWEKREAQFREREALIQSQLQQMVVYAQQVDADLASAAPSEAAASDVGDLGDLEATLADEPQWKTVAKGKRKALLAKSRGAWATKLQANLGSVGKTSSPFIKK